eukprot:UN18949
MQYFPQNSYMFHQKHSLHKSNLCSLSHLLYHLFPIMTPMLI